MKKSRPILFSTPMVQAIKAGLKSMTRRSIKIDPEEWKFKEIINGEKGTWAVFCHRENRGNIKHVKFRFGNIGDGLWVKETYTITGHGLKYKADGELSSVKWKSSMFMPRVASRLNFEITGLKVERAGDISTEDILKEGVRIPVSELPQPKGRGFGRQT